MAWLRMLHLDDSKEVGKLLGRLLKIQVERAMKSKLQDSASSTGKIRENRRNRHPDPSLPAG